MKIHLLQHVEFEGLGYFNQWIIDKHHKLSATKLFNGEKLPDTNDFDLLIIMGGPMGVYDYSIYPWLKDERSFIQRAIQSQKYIIGICLGAQLIADALGAKVYANAEKEIGWFPIYPEENALGSDYFPVSQVVFHWHGDTFDLPDGAVHLVHSNATNIQAFQYKNNVLALQFHLEMTKEALKSIVTNCIDEIIPGNYIQDTKSILNSNDKIINNNKLLINILEKFIK